MKYIDIWFCVYRKHEDMSSCTCSRANSNCEWFALRDGRQQRTMVPESTPAPTIGSSLLTTMTHPWKRIGNNRIVSHTRHNRETILDRNMSILTRTCDVAHDTLFANQWNQIRALHFPIYMEYKKPRSTMAYMEGCPCKDWVTYLIMGIVNNALRPPGPKMLTTRESPKSSLHPARKGSSNIYRIKVMHMKLHSFEFLIATCEQNDTRFWY